MQVELRHRNMSLSLPHRWTTHQSQDQTAGRAISTDLSVYPSCNWSRVDEVLVEIVGANDVQVGECKAGSHNELLICYQKP